MKQTTDELWLAFEALARTYPHDEGVRLTAHLARWLVEERRRAQLPIPADLDRVMQAVAKVVKRPDSRRSGEPAVTGA